MAHAAAVEHLPRETEGTGDAAGSARTRAGSGGFISPGANTPLMKRAMSATA